MLNVCFHGMVHADQPICLVGKNSYQRGYYEYGNMFYGEFHANKDNSKLSGLSHLIRLNNTKVKNYSDEIA